VTLDDLFSRCEPEQNSGCWLWSGGVTQFGYGRLAVKNRVWLAHRLSMALAGHDVDGWCVLHRCDTPACVNPAHLWLGTRSDNAEDAKRKGRFGYIGSREDFRAAVRAGIAAAKN
jgi:hypothetical protein